MTLSNPIVQLDSCGKFVREWLSSQEVDRETNIHGTVVRKCCRNKVKSAGGYKWMYAKDYYNTITENTITL